MWDADTVIEDRVRLPSKRKKLLSKLMKSFAVPAKGVVIVMDDHDYEGYINPVWRLQGLHVNIKHGGVEEMSPAHLLEIMESREFEHLVWVSRRVSECKELEFVWTIAHELRHLQQDLVTFALSQAGFFLSNTLGSIHIEEPRVVLVVPTELDAELAAWGAARRFFGNDVADSYVSYKATSEKGFRYLSSHDPGQPYDVLGKTVELLRKYQSQLEEVRKTSRDIDIQQFDIGEACKELNRVKEGGHP